MNRVDALMLTAVDDGVFPGAVLLAACYDEIVFHRAYGVVDPFSQRPVTCDTVYDLASLTKPLATAAALMDLVAAGRVCAESRLADIIPDFAGTDKAGIKICQLLCHNSGMPEYHPYYLSLKQLPLEYRKQELRRMLVKEPLLYSPETITCYSDPGFMILEWIVECISGKSLDRYVGEYIYSPLGIRELFFMPEGLCPDSETMVFAPTEATSAGAELICGRVHDENAEAVGGVSGHAGLFGTARAVFDLVLDLLLAAAGGPENTVFSGPVVRSFLNVPKGAERAMGFDVPSCRDSSSGRYFTPGSTFGHLGFTGVSFWMDFASGITVVLLSNRVCPGRENQKIRTFRPVIHDAVMEYIWGVKNN
ncbi:MAG: beta-lactamase family protein [Desulfobacteraceae bacterium]|nr:beta-lactamase family protein [Desulfobacteraceae bacterium]MCF8094043.1 beta-lactamase family protein [Desulfobacteraceae bacterium]